MTGVRWKRVNEGGSHFELCDSWAIDVSAKVLTLTFERQQYYPGGGKPRQPILIPLATLLSFEEVYQ